jgi:hypothetical protein
VSITLRLLSQSQTLRDNETFLAFALVSDKTTQYLYLIQNKMNALRTMALQAIYCAADINFSPIFNSYASEYKDIIIADVFYLL